MISEKYHPPTIYFPMIVNEALMTEATETESKETLDEFADAMIKIAEEANTNPELLKEVPHANDLIHEATLAIANDMDVESISRTIHAHPTLSEAFMEAIHDLEGKSIHTAPKRKRR